MPGGPYDSGDALPTCQKTIDRGSRCLDCGTPTFCGHPHGAGHDHSNAAEVCTATALAAAPSRVVAREAAQRAFGA